MYTKEQLFSLLKKVYENKDQLIIGEEMSNKPDMVSFTLERFKKNNGKYPGILGLDIRKANLASLGEAGRARVVKELTEYADKGGIVTCSAHLANPKNKNPDAHDYRGFFGFDEAWEEMMTAGNEVNKYFMIELSAIADFLEALKNNNVPVIWRPLHETNGGWFWFCMVQTDPASGEKRAIREETFVNAWRYIYEYFTKERKLDNLLWEFGPNMVADDAAGMVRALYGYPGDMCDLVGFDWYSGGNYEISKNSTYKDLASKGKPVAFAEWGVGGAIRAKTEEGQKQSELFTAEDLLALIRKMSSDGYSGAYLLTWTSPWTVNEMSKGDILMSAEGMLGLEDVANML